MARYVHTTDAKGRIFIPARLRKKSAAVLCMSPNPSTKDI